MYRRYSRDQLQTYGWWFLSNLKRIVTQEKAIGIKDFLKNQFTLGTQVQYRDGTEPLFRCILNGNDKTTGEKTYTLIDEKEKIELIVDNTILSYLHNTLKSNKQIATTGESLLDQLFQEYQQWSYRTINDKPYIVYDIETLYAIGDLKNLPFQLGYTLTSSDHQEFIDQQMKYVEKDAIKKYVDHLLAFDGYIIWFNICWFDNIVIAYSAWYGEDEIAQLNAKSLDIFYYLRNTTNKRLWLNKVATALIGLQKTLAGWWEEWSELLKDRINNGNEHSLKKVKEYCKWDVKMTLGVLLYLYAFWEFFIDWEQYCFDEQWFLEQSRDNKPHAGKKQTMISTKDWLFW